MLWFVSLKYCGRYKSVKLNWLYFCFAGLLTGGVTTLVIIVVALITVAGIVARRRRRKININGKHELQKKEYNYYIMP